MVVQAIEKACKADTAEQPEPAQQPRPEKPSGNLTINDTACHFLWWGMPKGGTSDCSQRASRFRSAWRDRRGQLGS
jgi:hypothetical protein